MPSFIRRIERLENRFPPNRRYVVEEDGRLVDPETCEEVEDGEDVTVVKRLRGVRMEDI